MALGSSIVGRIPPRRFVALNAWQYRLSEPELGRLREFVPRGRDAVDVGVWWGPWSWWLARWVRRVDAFEPNPDIVPRLATALPPNVHLHPVALSDRTGDVTLWTPGRGMGTEGRSSLEPERAPGAGWRPHTVTTRRLDDFDLGDVGFVKIDVEGHELAVLRGATSLIEIRRPVLLIEIESRTDGPDHHDEILQFLGDRSYRATYLSRGRWHPVEDLDRRRTEVMADRVSRRGYAANLLLFVRRYVHNFLFTPI